MIMCTNYRDCIEMQFARDMDFDKRICFYSKNSVGINEITLKIVLLKFTDDVTYRNNYIYDLLKNIKLTISETTVFECTFEQLIQLDTITRNYEGKIKCKDNNGSIYYPIYLADIFDRLRNE